MCWLCQEGRGVISVSSPKEDGTMGRPKFRTVSLVHETWSDHDFEYLVTDIGVLRRELSCKPASIYDYKMWAEPLNLQTHLKLGTPISLINTRDHQRWWLPNRDYWYEVRIINKIAYHRIVHNESLTEYEKFHLPVYHPRYAEIAAYAQKLAEKNYPRPQRKEAEKQNYVYNVVNVAENAKRLMPEDTAFLHLAQAYKAMQVVKHPDQTFEIMEYEV